LHSHLAQHSAHTVNNPYWIMSNINVKYKW